MTNVQHKTAIGQTIFYVESVAHLQGQERELLPVADAARAEHEALLECVETLKKIHEMPAGYMYEEVRELARAALAKLG